MRPRIELLAISDRIFGTVRSQATGSNARTGRKVLRKRLAGPTIAAWYPPSLEDIRTTAAEYTSEQEEYRADKLGRLKRRGKGPPKKGQGKKATRGA